MDKMEVLDRQVQQEIVVNRLLD
jgi:hypothetical protein